MCKKKMMSEAEKGAWLYNEGINAEKVVSVADKILVHISDCRISDF